jgi:DNA-binding transcriptional MerR regulator
MKTVRNVSIISGLSRRTLQYYDEIDLLKPAATKPSGYRLYDEDCLQRLWRILFYKELGFSLEEIKKILDNTPEMEKKLMTKHRLLLIEKQKRLTDIINSSGRILNGSFEEIMLNDFNMKAFEETKQENQKITIRKLSEDDPFYDFFRPLIQYKLTSRIGVSSMIRNIRSSSNMDWDAIRLKGEEMGAAFFSAMEQGYPSDSFYVMKIVSNFKKYVDEHISSSEEDVMPELAKLYLKYAEYIDKDHEGLAKFVSESLIHYSNK